MAAAVYSLDSSWNEGLAPTPQKVARRRLSTVSLLWGWPRMIKAASLSQPLSGVASRPSACQYRGVRPKPLTLTWGTSAGLFRTWISQCHWLKLFAGSAPRLSFSLCPVLFCSFPFTGRLVTRALGWPPPPPTHRLYMWPATLLVPIANHQGHKGTGSWGL